jgi:hypothetical protein
MTVINMSINLYMSGLFFSVASIAITELGVEHGCLRFAALYVNLMKSISRSCVRPIVPVLLGGMSTCRFYDKYGLL